MTEKIVHKITLVDGFTDKKGVVHKDVEFSKRLSMADMFALDDDPQASIQTQREDLVRRMMITKFGTLPIPVPLNYLLQLSSIDREDLADGDGDFTRQGNGDRKVEFPDNKTVIVPFGFIIENTAYNKITFGNLPTGMDEVEADKLGYSGLKRNAFLIGKHISSIATEDGLIIEGTVDLDTIGTMDSFDWGYVQLGCDIFRSGYRAERRKVSGGRNGDSGVSNDEAHRDDGKTSSKPPDTEA